MHLFLHIGGPKTGSTALQEDLHAKRHTLATRGILYPEITHKTKQHFFVPYIAGYDIQGINLRQNLDSHIHLESLARFNKDVSTHKYKSVVLSSEVLSQITSSQMFKLNAFLSQIFSSISVIKYVRHPIPYMLSQMAQHVRSADPLDYDYFSDKHYRNTMQIAERNDLLLYCETFGHSNVCPYIYERDFHNEWNICDHFYNEVLGLGIKSKTQIDTAQNRSMSYRSALFLAELQYVQPEFNGHNYKKNPNRSHKISRLIYKFDADGPRLGVPSHLKEEMRKRIKKVLTFYERNFGLVIPEYKTQKHSDLEMSVDKEFLWNFFQMIQQDVIGKKSSKGQKTYPEQIQLDARLVSGLAQMINSLSLEVESKRQDIELPSDVQGVLNRETSNLSRVLSEQKTGWRDQLIVYGVGRACDLMLPYLEEQGVTIRFFIDVLAEKKQITKVGQKVKSIKALKPNESYHILICSFSKFEEIKAEIFKYSSSRGIKVLLYTVAGVFEN